jgi:secondary thiamine-phosphate synthase enzyme
MANIYIKTRYKREVVDITEDINAQIKKLDIDEGICVVFVKHTTAGIISADLDPGGTDRDYLDALEKIVPKLKYRHPHDPEHMPDHILSSLVGTSISIPIKKGRLDLGTWQRIALVEFDGPREREIALSFIRYSAENK